MVNGMDDLDRIIDESRAVQQAFGPELKREILRAVETLAAALCAGRRVFAAGNGGSAADAEHLVAELVGRFLRERAPLDALALSGNSATLTGLVNDYPPEELFARQVAAHLRAGDVLLVFSTSGDSANIVRALEAARQGGGKTIGLTGQAGGKMAPLCDILLRIPSQSTPRIQEAHILVVHAICELLESTLTDRP